MPPIIEAEGLHKHYGDVHALDGLDLSAESGRLTALLGPNGAGKTTFISAVATLLRPTSGVLRVDGIDVSADPKAVRRIIGLAGQYASVEPAMTGRENLEMVGRLFGLDKRSVKSAAAAASLGSRRVPAVPVSAAAATPSGAAVVSYSVPPATKTTAKSCRLPPSVWLSVRP